LFHAVLRSRSRSEERTDVGDRFVYVRRPACVVDRQQPLLSPWPVPLPEGWSALVNEPRTEAGLAAARRAGARGGPPRAEARRRTAERLGLQHTVRPRGRPPG